MEPRGPAGYNMAAVFSTHTYFLTQLSSPGRNHHIFPVALPDADIHNAIFLILIPRNLVFKREGEKKGTYF